MSIFAFISIRLLFIQRAFDIRASLRLDASLGVCFGLRLRMSFGAFSSVRLRARFLLLLKIFLRCLCSFHCRSSPRLARFNFCFGGSRFVQAVVAHFALPRDAYRGACRCYCVAFVLHSFLHRHAWAFVMNHSLQDSCGVLFLCARFSCASALFARAVAMSCGRFRMRLCTAVRVQCQAVRSFSHTRPHRRRYVMQSFCARLRICVDIVARSFIVAFFAGIFFSLIVLF